MKEIVMCIMWNRAALVLLVTGLSAFAGTVHSAEQAPAATQSVQQLIDGLCANYERWIDLPGFEVQYRIVGEELVADSSYAWGWGWGWGEFTNIVKPKENAKMYVRWKHPAYPKDYIPEKGTTLDPKVRDAICNDIGTADGTMFISLEEKPHTDGTKGLVATLIPLSKGKQFVIHNTYYFDFLAYPANLDPEDGVTARARFIKGSYWLPVALRDNTKTYVVRPVCEKVGEDWCHVLERPGDRAYPLLVYWLITRVASVEMNSLILAITGKPLETKAVKSPRIDGLSEALLTVIIPVYNELATIGELIPRVLSIAHPKEVIIVDDGSTDGTSMLLLKEWSSHPEITLLQHPHNRGKGAAIRNGLKNARGRFTLVQDADLEYDPCDYPRLLEPLLLGKADVVYGSRYVQHLQPSPNSRSCSRLFRYGVSLLNLAVRLLYGVRLTDEATCYKVFPTDVLRAMDLQCERFEFCPEVTAKACRMGLTIAEVPIHYAPRTAAEGKKIRWTDGWEALATLWKWRRWIPIDRNACEIGKRSEVRSCVLTLPRSGTPSRCSSHSSALAGTLCYPA